MQSGKDVRMAAAVRYITNRCAETASLAVLVGDKGSRNT